MRETESENTVENPSQAPGPALLPYLLKALLAAAVITALIQLVDRSGVWLFSLLCLLLAVPMFCQGAYFRAARRMHWLLVFRDGGLLHRLISGVKLRLGASAAIGLALAFVMAFRLRALAWQEWLTCLAAIPVFWVVAYFLRKLVDEADPRFRVFVRARSASWLTVPVLLLMYGVLIVAVPDPSAPELAPWMRQGDGEPIVSAAVAELGALHDGWRALEAFVLGRISELGEWGWAAALVIFVAGNIAFFYACVSMLACFSIPQAELSRAFCRVTTGAKPPTPPLSGVVLASAICTIFACSLYFPLAAKFEATLAQLAPEHRPMHQFREWAAAVNADLQPDPVQLEGHPISPPHQAKEITAAGEVNPEPPPEQLPRQAKIVVEKIGDQFYRVGALKKANDARLGLLSSELEDLALLRQGIHRGFDLMEDNIDDFLDWYYSLSGEYARLVKLLTGAFEGYLADRFSAYLSQGAPFEEYERTFSALLESESDLKRQYKETIERILAENSVAVDDPSRVVVAEEIADADSLFSYKNVVASIEARLATSGLLGGAGVAGGAAVGVKVTGVAGKKVTAVVGKKVAAGVAKAVTKKLAVKGTFKAAAQVAAKVAAKLAASRAASGVGMLVGGTVGSIVPVTGTIAGAVAGGAIVGLAFGIGADAVLLQLDESMNRDEFRTELVDALNAERQRVLDAISPSIGHK